MCNGFRPDSAPRCTASAGVLSSHSAQRGTMGRPHAPHGPGTTSCGQAATRLVWASFCTVAPCLYSQSPSAPQGHNRRPSPCSCRPTIHQIASECRASDGEGMGALSQAAVIRPCASRVRREERRGWTSTCLHTAQLMVFSSHALHSVAGGRRPSEWIRQRKRRASEW